MKIKEIYLGILFSAAFLMPGCQNNNEKNSPALGDKEIAALVSQMTPDEKIGMTVGDGKFLPQENKDEIEQGKGIIIANQQANVVIPRLNINKTVLTDGPAGINRDPHPEGATGYTYTTAFPTSTCLASTWNTEILEQVGKAYGEEALDYDYDVVLMPAMNIHRNPKCGRNFEYYSEDPLLSGKLAASMVIGLQSKGIGSTLKHFLGNNQESNRRTYNAVISRRALREIYLRGFEIAVKEGKPEAIMTAYNKVNGFYTAENPELLQDIARKEWGYEGIFMTDFDGYGSAVAKVRAGNNMLMGGNMDELNELTAALKDKTLSEATLDKNLEYNMRLKQKSPRENGHVPSMKPDLEAHAKVALDAASEGMVLLKNENDALPFKNVNTVAVFGKMAYYLIEAGTGSGSVRSNKYAVSVNEGLKNAGFNILPEMEKNYVGYIEKIKRENLVPDYFNNPKMRADNGIKGDQAPAHFKERLVAFSKEQALPKKEILKSVGKSDIAVITLGRSAGENYENGYLPITQVEMDLVKDVCEVYHAAGKKAVVVLNVAGVWETASWRDMPDAILLAWLPGQEGGNVVAQILKGDINPSGKLPDSFPLKYEDVPSASTFPGVPADDPVNSFYTEGVYVGYRYYDSFDVPVAYEFGYGLSYTTFEYSDIKLSGTNFSGEITASVTVKNTGEVAGKEVAQLYLSAPVCCIDKPNKELKGFAKTKLLQPGEGQVLTFELDARLLASFQSGISAWLADKGEYKILIGASSKDIRQEASFNLQEDIIVEKVNDVLYPNFAMKEIKPTKK